MDEDEDTGADQDAGAGTDAADDVGMGDSGDADGAADAGFNPAEDDPSQDPALADAGGAYAQPDEDMQSPTVQTLLDTAQGLMDMCKATEAGMKKSEHMKGRKYASKLCADLRKTAAEAKSFAEKVKAELAGPMDDSSGTGDDEPDGDEATEPDGDEGGDDEAPEPETDDDGAIVSKGYTPRRWTHADIGGTAAPAATAAAKTDSPSELKALRAENRKLQKTLERILDDIEAGKNR